ncbi:MAG: UMP kinase [Promethearchaeota archaeon]
MSKKIVLKIGGSLLFDNEYNILQDKIVKFAEIIRDSEDIVAIIIGGGKLARNFIESGRYLGASESLCDTFGIEVSRLNARLLITALKDLAYPEPITSLKDVRAFSLWNRILVAGGFIPGQSTTSVTFEIAESLHATDVIILTNVDGIYDKDPNKYPKAKKFDEISILDLEKVIAGEYRIFDAVSLQILKRSNIQVRLSNGEDFNTLRKLLVEKAFESNIGTKILRNH